MSIFLEQPRALSLGFETCLQTSRIPGSSPSTTCSRCRPTCRASPSKNCSASSGSPTSSNWRRTKIPTAPSPRALAAMQRAIGETWLYPDGSGHVLKTRLAAKLGLDVAQITLGNGSNDLLVLLAEAFLQARPRSHLLAIRVRRVSDRRPGDRRDRRGDSRPIRLGPPCRWGTTLTRWRAPLRRARASCSSPTLTIPPAPGCRRRR